jgi:hypothetical protein
MQFGVAAQHAVLVHALALVSAGHVAAMLLWCFRREWPQHYGDGDSSAGWASILASRSGACTARRAYRRSWAKRASRATSIGRAAGLADRGCICGLQQRGELF